MAVQLAAEGDVSEARPRFKLPEAVPPFGTRSYRLFSLLWIAALLLAVVGPAMGLYQRYSNPGDNSQLMLGSRAGIAVSAQDATRIRFAIGPEAKKAGIEPGDDIVAIYGLPLPRQMPITEQVLAERADDPAYIAMGNLLFGTEVMEVPLTVRSTDGTVREVTLTTGEQHINAAVARYGITALMLSFVDLVHVIFYPMLIWVAWILHRRNRRDAVSSTLSLAILLIIGSEQPSSGFLASMAVPRWVNVLIYDVGNISLLAGILLFPHGKLSPRLIALLAALPLLMLLHGKAYQALFVMFMLLAVLMLIRCLRHTHATDLRQQIRWALFGLSGYALFRILSIGADIYKPLTGSFPAQLGFELFAGLALGLSMLVLQFGLLIALLRFRLYDAEVVISRSANVAVIIVTIAAIFQVALGYFGNAGGFAKPALFAIALAAVLLNPLQERIQRWSEKKFQKHLFLLRDDLPENVRDMRETASLKEMVDEILVRVEKGVRSIRSAMIVNSRIVRARGITMAELETWRSSQLAEDYATDIFEASDKVFPIRVPLVPSSDNEAPLGFLLVGPRPDGSVPSRDEQKALAGVAESIARAIQTVIKREARERQIAELIEANTRRIDELEAMLGAGPDLSRKGSPRRA